MVWSSDLVAHKCWHSSRSWARKREGLGRELIILLSARVNRETPRGSKSVSAIRKAPHGHRTGLILDIREANKLRYGCSGS